MRTILTLAVALLIASPVFAGPKIKGEKTAEKKAPTPATQMVDQMTKNLTLTDDQMAKLDVIKKDFDPKLADAGKAVKELLTPEQRKAGQEAAKAAMAAGKTKQEIHQAFEDAIQATPEQKTKMADVQNQYAGVTKDIRERVLEVLTPEQKEQLKPKKKEKNK